MIVDSSGRRPEPRLAPNGDDLPSHARFPMFRKRLSGIFQTITGSAPLSPSVQRDESEPAGNELAADAVAAVDALMSQAGSLLPKRKRDDSDDSDVPGDTPPPQAHAQSTPSTSKEKKAKKEASTASMIVGGLPTPEAWANSKHYKVRRLRRARPLYPCMS